MPDLVAIGACNTDLVVTVDEFPRPGQTVLAKDLRQFLGGKGANQAVAARRLGADAAFIARIGADPYGEEQAQALAREGLDPACFLRDDPGPSGLALIALDAQAQNSIIVAAGSNGRLSPQDIERRRPLLEGARLILLELEIPLLTARRAMEIARAAGVKTLLNPAPALALGPEVLSLCDYLVPNETEAEVITGKKVHDLESCRAAAAWLKRRGVGEVILTLGERGAFWGGKIYPARRVKVQDTVAAGDAFIGALAAELMRGRELARAIEFANRAAAVAVSRPGAMPSLPTRAEVEALLPEASQPIADATFSRRSG